MALKIILSREYCDYLFYYVSIICKLIIQIDRLLTVFNHFNKDKRIVISESKV